MGQCQTPPSSKHVKSGVGKEQKGKRNFYDKIKSIKGNKKDKTFGHLTHSIHIALSSLDAFDGNIWKILCKHFYRLKMKNSQVSSAHWMLLTNDIESQKLSCDNWRIIVELYVLIHVHRVGFLTVGKKLLKNPNTYATLAGLAWAFISFMCKVKLPKVVETTVFILTDGGLGMAMFSIVIYLPFVHVLAKPGGVKTYTKFDAEIYVLTKDEGGHQPASQTTGLKLMTYWYEVTHCIETSNKVVILKTHKDYVPICMEALVTPTSLMAQNAGVEGEVVVEKVKDNEWEFGYNAMTDKYENVVESGVIDPAKEL
ncbi:chaperonin 60 alpha subunit [Artemisia annua]|uniref:Chaperonin 60 alpha subunit n=1 Tax=Artemisia annua TaxID=35608 RepID=A0A2U1PB73_ARTAN|nr:chaperonin 60 alpha subunit [Artemisia annua]